MPSFARSDKRQWNLIFWYFFVLLPDMMKEGSLSAFASKPLGARCPKGRWALFVG
jgi:hypothetical protein